MPSGALLLHPSSADRTLRLTRRALLGGGAALVVTAGSARAQGLHDNVHRLGHALRERVQLTAAMLGIAPPPMHDPGLLVAGSADSASGAFASAIADALGHALPAHAPLGVTDTVGQDGVTGANQFDSLTAPDGNTALVAPGTAWLAWLAGDPRVHFDPSRWMPVAARLGSGALVLRHDTPTPGPDVTIRLAATSPTGVELPAWLALSLLGAKVVAVPGLGDDEERRRALIDGRIDAALLLGTDTASTLGSFAGEAATAAFSLGSERDPALPALPSFVQYATTAGRTPSGALFDAWQAGTAAARLLSGVMLPALAPAAMVATWRRAARGLPATPGLLAAPACLPACQTALGSEAATFALRRWLADTAGWRPA